MKIVFFYATENLEKYGLMLKSNDDGTAFMMLSGSSTVQAVSSSIRKTKEAGVKNLFILFDSKNLFKDVYIEAGFKDSTVYRKHSYWGFLDDNDKFFLAIVPSLIGYKEENFELSRYLCNHFWRDCGASFFHACAFNFVEIIDCELVDNSESRPLNGLNTQYMLDSFDLLYGGVENVTIEKAIICPCRNSYLQFDVFSGVSLINELILYISKETGLANMEMLKRKLVSSMPVVNKCIIYTDLEDTKLINEFMYLLEDTPQCSYSKKDRLKNALNYHFSPLPAYFDESDGFMLLPEKPGIYVVMEANKFSYCYMHEKEGARVVSDSSLNYRCLVPIINGWHH